MLVSVHHTCTIILTMLVSVYHTCAIIFTVARFRSSYLLNHTDYGTLPFIIPLLQSYWLWHASVYHTSSTIILTVAHFRLSYLIYNHTDCDTLPFIILVRSYLQRAKQYKQIEEKGRININTRFSSKWKKKKHGQNCILTALLFPQTDSCN